MSNEQGCCNYCWLELPRDITINILGKAGALHMLLTAQLVCTQWREICTDPSTWTTIRVVDWFSYMNMMIPQFNLKPYQYRIHVETTIRRAIDQSCGTLFDLDLDELMYQNILPYAAKRCTKIKRFRVAPMWHMDDDDDDVLERVAPNLPLLEDLEFYGRLSLAAIETLGRYCPRLSSLKIRIYGDEQAKVIGRNMPQLRRICISGENFVTAVGVEAILDGCVHLESLDLDIRHPLNPRIKGTFQMRKKTFPLTRTQEVTIRVGMIKMLPLMSHENCEKFKYVKDVIRRVVDKTCGELVDVDLDIFISAGDMLSYVVERCTQIRRLRGYMSFYCSEKVLHTAAAKLLLLENLELVYYTETIGRCCHRLTSLEIPIDNDEGAKAIARSFLKPLNADQQTDVGVEALLNSYCHIDSLNMQGCGCVELNGMIWSKCIQQIKYLRIPNALLERPQTEEEIQTSNGR